MADIGFSGRDDLIRYVSRLKIFPFGGESGHELTRKEENYI